LLDLLTLGEVDDPESGSTFQLACTPISHINC
jgi:hypothetical protein